MSSLRGRAADYERIKKMSEINACKVTMTAFIGGLTAIWGWMGWLVLCWVSLMLMDYITGSAAAAKEGRWSSKVAREGIWHKVGMAVVVTVSAVSDLLIHLVMEQLPVLPFPIAFCGLLCPMVLVWYCITELGSITENAVSMGAKVPKWLRKFLEISQKAVDQTAEGLAAEKKE